MTRVFVAEDNPYNLDLIEQILEDDYEVITATDGELALAGILEHRPDLILMDIAMPKMGGLQVTQAIRANPEVAHIPVIALTAHAVRGFREQAVEAGVDAYITKPVDEDELFATLEEWTGKRSPHAG